MAKYEPGDIATFYFIINEIDSDDKIIQGYTDNKDLAKYYMEFHKCKKFTLKSMTKTIEDISVILEENRNDEIKIYNITIRDPKHKDGRNTKMISIPATDTEMRFLNEETKTYFSSHICYTLLNEAKPFMKRKYQEALDTILLQKVIDVNINAKPPAKILINSELDQLMLLFRSFSDNFGR